MDEHEDRLATFDNGRQVAYSIYGIDDATVPTVFYLHGFPGSHHEGYLVHDPAVKEGVRIIAVSRPGSSKSIFYNYTIADYPADILALADALSVRRFAILGVSGGGPFAISCYRTLPRNRLAGVGLVAPLMPVALGTGGMMMKTRILLALAPWAPGLIRWVLDSQMGTVARDTAHPEKFANMMDKDFDSREGIDRDVYRNHPVLREVLLRSGREAMAGDAQSVAWEAKLFGSQWGFELSEVKVDETPMVVWHGDLDVNVPFSMAEKATALMPGAQLRPLKGESHMTLITKTGDFIAEMKQMLARF